MFAVIGESFFGPGQWVAGRDQRQEFTELLARQPGFRGLIIVDTGDGQRLWMVRWDSEAHSAATRPILVPAADRLLRPLYIAP